MKSKCKYYCVVSLLQNQLPTICCYKCFFIRMPTYKVSIYIISLNYSWINLLYTLLVYRTLNIDFTYY